VRHTHSLGSVLLWLALLAVPAVAEEPTLEEPAGRRGALLPLQDRTGKSEIAVLVNKTLRRALQFDFELTPTEPTRDALRNLRVRDAGATAPVVLRELADRLGVTWFLSPTLHRVSSNPVELTLSAWAYRVEDDRLAWAGFHSASGTGPRRALLGQRYVSLETLAVELAVELTDDFRRSVGGLPLELPRTRPNKDGFLPVPLPLEQLGLVALLPFESVTDKTPIRNGETLTAVVRAGLYRQGVALVHPGLVESVLRRRGIYLRGELAPLDRAALGIAGKADHVLSGAVEVYDSSGGLEPKPRVAFSVRMVDVEDGRIVWFNGEDRTGWDRQKLYGLNRIYDPGTLAEMMFRSMIAGVLALPGR